MKFRERNIRIGDIVEFKPIDDEILNNYKILGIHSYSNQLKEEFKLAQIVALASNNFYRYKKKEKFKRFYISSGDLKRVIVYDFEIKIK